MSDSNAHDEPRKPWPEVVKRFVVGCADAGLVAGKPQRRDLVSLGMPVERIATGYKVVDNAHFAGDAFFLPSFSEGLPMAVLEAWSYALPTFVTDMCNLPEGFAAGAAIRIEPEADALAATLATELGDDARLRRAGCAGRRLVAERFTWERVATAWLRIYHAAVADGTDASCIRQFCSCEVN